MWKVLNKRGNSDCLAAPKLQILSKCEARALPITLQGNLSQFSSLEAEETDGACPAEEPMKEAEPEEATALPVEMEKEEPVQAVHEAHVEATAHKEEAAPVVTNGYMAEAEMAAPLDAIAYKALPETAQPEEPTAHELPSETAQHEQPSPLVCLSNISNSYRSCHNSQGWLRVAPFRKLYCASVMQRTAICSWVQTVNVRI